MSRDKAPFQGARAKALARRMIGDAKQPNCYFVSAGSSITALDTSDPKFHFWNDATEVAPEFKEFIIDRFETWGPYPTYRAAWDKFYEIYGDIVDEPTVRNGFHSVFIEDRLSGEVASGGLHAEKGQWGWRFHRSFREDTKFTSDKVGYDIRRFNSKKEADNA